VNDGSDQPPLFFDREVVQNAQLQLLLYFSTWLDLLFAGLHLCTAVYKWRTPEGMWPLIIFGMVYLYIIALEPMRLYIGYAGNLGERVSHLLVFNLVTTFPCILMLGAAVALSQISPELQPSECKTPGGPCILPVERACWIVRLAMLVWELKCGISALSGLIRAKSARFFLSLELASATAVPNTGSLNMREPAEDEPLLARSPGSQLLANRGSPSRSGMPRQGPGAAAGAGPTLFGRATADINPRTLHMD